MWRKLQSPREEMSAKESGRMWLQRGTIPAQSPSTAMKAAATLPFPTGWTWLHDLKGPADGEAWFHGHLVGNKEGTPTLPLELRRNHRKRRNSMFPQPWSNRGLRDWVIEQQTKFCFLPTAKCKLLWSWPKMIALRSWNHKTFVATHNHGQCIWTE